MHRLARMVTPSRELERQPMSRLVIGVFTGSRISV
jgi:hypothetical protein